MSLFLIGNGAHAALNCQPAAEAAGQLAMAQKLGPGTTPGQIQIEGDLTQRIGGSDSETTFSVTGALSNSTVELGAVVTVNNSDCSAIGSFGYYQSSK